MTLACIKSWSTQGQPTLSPQLRSWGRGRSRDWPSLYLQRNQRLRGNQSRNQRLSGNQSSAWRERWGPDMSGPGQSGCSGRHWGEGQPRKNSGCSPACPPPPPVPSSPVPIALSWKGSVSSPEASWYPWVLKPQGVRLLALDISTSLPQAKRWPQSLRCHVIQKEEALSWKFSRIRFGLTVLGITLTFLWIWNRIKICRERKVQHQTQGITGVRAQHFPRRSCFIMQWNSRSPQWELCFNSESFRNPTGILWAVLAGEAQRTCMHLKEKLLSCPVPKWWDSGARTWRTPSTWAADFLCFWAIVWIVGSSIRCIPPLESRVQGRGHKGKWICFLL